MVLAEVLGVDNNCKVRAHELHRKRILAVPRNDVGGCSIAYCSPLMHNQGQTLEEAGLKDARPYDLSLVRCDAAYAYVAPHSRKRALQLILGTLLAIYAAIMYDARPHANPFIQDITKLLEVFKFVPTPFAEAIASFRDVLLIKP